MIKENQEFQKIWPEIVAKAWSDSAFKENLLNNPHQVFQSYGLTIPSGIQCVINENTENTVYLTLPKKQEGSLSEEQIAQIAAGHVSTGIF